MVALVPGNWREMMAAIAYTFHGFTERELWTMPGRRMLFWIDRANWVRRQEARR